MKKQLLTLILSVLLIGWTFWGLAQGVMAQSGPDFDELKMQFWLDAPGMDASPSQITVQTSPPEDIEISDAKTYPFGYASLMTFQSFLDGNWNIFLSNGNYEKLWRLTDDPASDVEPRLNAAGDAVVFASKRHGNWDVFSLALDEGRLRRLTTDGRDEGTPTWSPDGRQIAYSKKAGEHYVLYLMAADGSGQRRLSFPGNADDIQPDFSPDGRHITFVRRHDRGYGSLMVMDAHGGNVRELASALRYLQNPRWSPDGRRIAFDYDADGDEWNELAVIDVATGAIRTAIDFNERLTDAWFGAWTGEEDYAVIVRASYEIRDNRLYLKQTRLFLSRIDRHHYELYESSWVDARPDWRRVDNDPPTVTLDPLPRTSPAVFQVRWSGEDVGIAGLAYYEVQKKVGNGDWEMWLPHTMQTSAQFYGGGMAGKLISFRVRAADRAGNVTPWSAAPQIKTVIETLRPQVEFDPIPEMLRKCELISWQAEDPGGSGVSVSHFQLREAGTTEWRNLGPPNSMTRRICETAGRTYEFRVRVKDVAGNWSSWVYLHPVTLYQWKIAGRGADNRGRPLPVEADLSPPAFTRTTDAYTGRYASYTDMASQVYTVTWQAPGYLPLPATAFDGVADAARDIVFPPADNLLPDWGFEEDELTQNWQVEGRAAIIENARHTGRRALRLGEPLQFTREELWPGYAARLTWSPRGVGYLAFMGAAADGHGSEIYFATRSTDGSWSTLKNVSHHPDNFTTLTMQLDRERDILYLAWYNGMDWRYAVRRADGVWSPSELAPPPVEGWRSPYHETLDPALDAAGNFYLPYLVYRNKIEFYLSIRSLNGAWHSEKVVGNLSYSDISYVVQPGGEVHVVWFQESGAAQRLFYRHRLDTGQWEDPVQLPYPEVPFSQPISLVQDTSGALHLFWFCNADNGVDQLCHAERNLQGSWKAQEILVRGDAVHRISDWKVIADAANRIHLLLFRGEALLYRQRRADGSWSDDYAIDPLYSVPGFQGLWDYRMVVDAQNQVHFSWSRKENNADVGPETYYRILSPQGRLSSPIRVGPIIYADLATTPQGVAHIVGGSVQTSRLMYAHDALTARDGWDAISRSVHIPADMESPTLSLFAKSIGAPDAVIKVDDQTLPLCPDNQEEDWRHCWVDMAPWRGQTVNLRLEVKQHAGTLPIWADFDELTLGSGAFPDLWVAAPSLSLPSRQPQTLTLTYGNASDEVAARDVVITATLPSDALLISTSPPARVNGETLTWAFPELPPTNSGEIKLTLEMQTPDVLRSLYAAIETASLEPNQGNNEVEMALFVDGFTQRLPLMMR